MKKYLFRFVMVILICLLGVVSFYMLWVHIPYYNYHHQLDEIRNEICETNHYEYLDYFNEHCGKVKYYILKVKINGVESYVAYDQELKMVNLYQGQVADRDVVKKAILQKYDDIKDDDLNQLDIGYENNKFVYSVKVQRDDILIYLYYDLTNGEFVKTYRIKNHR